MNAPDDEFIKLTPEEQRARNRRSLWIALALGGFIVLVFFISIAQMKANSPPGGPPAHAASTP